ncbi:16395_t:CDS:1, partial [Funneliformis geosporum]
ISFEMIILSDDGLRNFPEKFSLPKICDSLIFREFFQNQYISSDEN